ncbi:MAG TPA: hypothetical protein VFT74_00185, partial [Isosphaeraceae bacterium]|nr:hypothetical protein [Isosphaeraceae bacterium]
MRLRLRIPGSVLLLALGLTVNSQAQVPGTTEKKTRGMDDPVVAKGVAYLKSRVVGKPGNGMDSGYDGGMGGGMEVGEAALAALAMHKADLPDNDPAIQACLKTILGRFGPNGFVPMRKGGHENYEYAVVCMCLTAIDPATYKPQIELLVRDLVRLQKSYGAWDYVMDKGGDTSMTQYCLLALWEAESIGIEISPKVWDTCAQFFIKTQFSDGGWS